MAPKVRKYEPSSRVKSTRKTATALQKESGLTKSATVGKKSASISQGNSVTPRQKRGRANEGAVAPRASKLLKTDLSINAPPSQRLDIFVFGEGSYGELGLGYRTRNGNSPTEAKYPRLNDLLDSKTVGVVQIAVGGMHCIALTHDNKIITWGVNDHGALGRDTTADANSNSEDEGSDDDLDMNRKESTPTAISSTVFGKEVKFSQVVATDSASFALTVTGSVYGWGTFSGNDGVFGFSKGNTLTAKSRKEKDIQRTPMLIPELKQIKFLAAGGNHILALDLKGRVFSWGCGEQNQLGRRIVSRFRENSFVPSEFGLPKRKVKDIASGTFHSFAADDRGRVFAWGLNNFGQTGISSGAGEANAIIETPTVVQSLDQFNIREIQGGNHHSIACTQDQKVLVWGRCDDSQMGIPTHKLPQSSLVFNSRNKPQILSEPTIIPGISAVTVAAGIDNSIAVNNEGEAYSWGFSENYRTGLGTDDSVEEPRKLQNEAMSGKKITFADCGGQFSVIAGLASIANGI